MTICKKIKKNIGKLKAIGILRLLNNSEDIGVYFKPSLQNGTGRIVDSHSDLTNTELHIVNLVLKPLFSEYGF